MQRTSDTIGALAGALAKAQTELVNPEKSLVASIREEGPRGRLGRLRRQSRRAQTARTAVRRSVQPPCGAERPCRRPGILASRKRSTLPRRGPRPL
jgi:hypothetical protein